MQQKKMDLSEKRYADQSNNKTAMIGIYIINVVLAIAYLIELLKGARTPESYALVLFLYKYDSLNDTSITSETNTIGHVVLKILLKFVYSDSNI